MKLKNKPSVGYQELHVSTLHVGVLSVKTVKDVKQGMSTLQRTRPRLSMTVATEEIGDKIDTVVLID